MGRRGAVSDRFRSVFSRLAVVTFGGACAVLAYMTETVVATKGWLSTAEMIDALGLAETAPGPLILVTEFVALLAGYAQDGVGMALMAALLDSFSVPSLGFICLAGLLTWRTRLSMPGVLGAMGALAGLWHVLI